MKKRTSKFGGGGLALSPLSKQPKKLPASSVRTSTIMRNSQNKPVKQLAKGGKGGATTSLINTTLEHPKRSALDRIKANKTLAKLN